MIFLGAQNTWSVAANTAFTPPKINWTSLGSSDSVVNNATYNLLNNAGVFTVTESKRYNITVYTKLSEFTNALNATASVSVQIIPVGASAYTIGTSSFDNSFFQILDLNIGDQIVLIYTFSTAINVTFNSVSLNNACEIKPYSLNLPVFLKASDDLNPISIAQPLTLDYSGTLTSGFKIVIPITRDRTTTGLASFKTITGIQVTPMLANVSTSVMNILSVSIDPLPTNLKTITIALGIGNQINTLLAGSVPSMVNPPLGSKVFVRLIGT